MVIGVRVIGEVYRGRYKLVVILVVGRVQMEGGWGRISVDNIRILIVII